MLGLLLSAFQILTMVNCSPLDNSRYLIDSQPLLFLDDVEAEAQVVNSTLVLKKKINSGGPVYYNGQKKDDTVNNHHVDTTDEAVVWKRPVKPITDVFSNHKGGIDWDQKRIKTSTLKPTPTSIKTVHIKKEVVVNNHDPSAPIRSRPHHPSSTVSVTDRISTSPPTDIIGDRLKQPDIIKSTVMQVLDAPKNVRTTIKHNKIIVIQKRTDSVSSNGIKQETTTTPPIQQSPDRGNFSVAAVMDPWPNVPIPSSPSWAQSAQSAPSQSVSSWAQSPVKGGVSRPVTQQQTLVPNLPFMPFFTSLLAPLLGKPLTPSAVNSGMQGIKAMQGFLRNSLMGAMFCFLPSAFIALSLTATQRAELRKIPEVDDMMFFCKKCLENLKDIKELANAKELKWMSETLE